MNVRLTATLAVVLAVLITAYVWSRRVGEERQEVEKREAKVVRIDSDKIVAIDLRPAENQDKAATPLSLIKEGGVWRLTAPLKLRADSRAVDDILSSIGEIQRSRVIQESAKALSAFGLKPAKLTVQYKLDGGEQGKLLFGEESPSGEGVYAAVEGRSMVYLLSQRARSPFEKSLYEVRDKTVLRRPRGEIGQIIFERDGKRYSLRKAGQDKWDMVEPVAAPGNTEAANYALGLTVEGKVQKFVKENPTAEDLKKFGLDPPKMRMTLADKDGKNPDVFVIGGQEEDTKNYYARKGGSGPLFTLERFSVEDLPKKPLEARKRWIFDFEKESVVKVELESPAGKVAIRQLGKNDEWEVEGADGKLPGNDRRISDMLWDIKYARIAHFYDEGSDKPDPSLVNRVTRKVALYVKGQEDKPLRFTVGQQGPSDPTQKDEEDRERWYARRDTDGKIFLLTRDSVNRISKGVWDFQERKALSFGYQDVAKLDFIYPKEKVEIEKDGRRWKMIEPLDEIAVGDKLDFILNEIHFMEFEKVVKDERPDFAAADLGVRVTLKDGKKLPLLRFVRNKEKKIAYVSRGKESRMYEIEDRFLDNVPKSYKGFLAKE